MLSSGQQLRGTVHRSTCPGDIGQRIFCPQDRQDAVMIRSRSLQDSSRR